MEITGSFLTEGGWVYVAVAMASVVLILVRALGVTRAGYAAAALLGLSLAAGLWFAAFYAKAIDEVPWHAAKEPSQRVLYDRCVAAGRPRCQRAHPTVSYYHQHLLLGVYLPLACAAALGAVTLFTRAARSRSSQGSSASM